MIYHLWFCPIINYFHLAMIFIHLAVHVEAVAIILRRPSGAFGNFSFTKLITRAFELAEGKNYEAVLNDYIYKMLTTQDIVTHGLNIIALVYFSGGEKLSL